jgi:hypothetical protein
MRCGKLRQHQRTPIRTKRQIAGRNWELDGTTIIVTIPMTWKRRGGRKVIIAPDGGDAWAPAKPRQDETLIRALARAHRWKRLLEDGTYRSAGEIAETEKVDRSFVNRVLRLTLLAPDIQEAILDGRQPKAMRLEELTRAISGEWQRQRDQLILLPMQEGGLERNQNRDCGHLRPDEAAEQLGVGTSQHARHRGAVWNVVGIAVMVCPAG